ncbi:MAG: alpha/beta hydrolase [Chloroflexota bacterium]
MKRKFIVTLAILLMTTACRLTRDVWPAPVRKTESPPASNAPTARPQFESAAPVLDIRYSDAKSTHEGSLNLDVYPATGADLPVVIFVHGGGWFRGDKSIVDAKSAAFNARGYVFVSVNYRLLPEVDVVQQMEDVARAVRWVKRNIGQYGGDPSQIFLMGHSAGAHLVALLATDESYLRAEGLALTDIQGVIALDAQTYDLVRLLKNIPEEVGGEVYWETFGHDPQFWEQMSPLWHVKPGKEIPPFFVVFTGEKESRAIISTLFVDTLQAAGFSAVLVPATEKTHGSLNRDFGLHNDRISTLAFDWLEELLH